MSPDLCGVVLSCRERLLRTLNGEQIDRIATFDVIHTVDLIEHLTGEKVTPLNAEDLFCKGISKVLDLVEHCAIPDRPDPWTLVDQNAFVYSYQW